MTYPALATLADLYAYGAPSSAFGALNDSQRLVAIEAASQKFLGFIASRGTLPLVAWGTDVIQAVCHVSAYDLLSSVGFNPNDGADTNFVTRKDDALRWWERIGKGETTPPSLVYSQSKAVGSFPRVISRTMRGW